MAYELPRYKAISENWQDPNIREILKYYDVYKPSGWVEKGALGIGAGASTAHDFLKEKIQPRPSWLKKGPGPPPTRPKTHSSPPRNWRK